MIKKINFLLFVFFVLICTNSLIGQVHKKSEIEWEIVLNALEDDSSHYELSNKFTLQGESEEIFYIEPMKKTLPVSIGKYEYDSTLLNKVHILDYYLFELNYSQYIIENDKGDFETFSFNTKMPKTGNHVIHTQFVIDEDCCFDKFYMTKNRIVAITEVVRLEQLKLSQGSEKIRLHYLFKGCSEVAEPFILTSNWVEL